ncbi:MAG: hypothetical protein M0Q14_10660 [Tissierellaceae bacterium]|nr:hypothetical protein [Tissierellaceae bacterium]
MFEYLRNVEGNSNPVMLHIKATASSSNQPEAGDLVAIASGLAAKATSDSTALVGVAKENTSRDGYVLVIIDERATYKVPTKTTLADSNLFGTFDLTDEVTVNFAASTKNVVQLLDYNNAKGEAVVKIARTKSVI